MNRRRLLTVLGSVLPLSGCVGGRGDSITMLAVNQDNTAHSVTVWAVQGENLEVANTVEIASKDVEELGQMPPDRENSERWYRVTVHVDDELVIAQEFQSEEGFNQLDVFIAEDGSIQLNRGTAA